MTAQSRVKTEHSEDWEFLQGYLKRLQRGYEASLELDYCDLFPPSEERTARWNAEMERAARIADKHGFDGSLFRFYLTNLYDDPLSSQAIRHLRRMIETIARIIAKLEEPLPDESRTAIPKEARLLKVPQVATVLGCGESVVRERDKRGLLPRPIRVGGAVQWRRDELEAWIRADCPSREIWERTRTQWMEEVNNVPTQEPVSSQKRHA